MRGKSPIDAQVMYIHALVELLEEVLATIKALQIDD